MPGARYNQPSSGDRVACAPDRSPGESGRSEAGCLVPSTCPGLQGSPVGILIILFFQPFYLRSTRLLLKLLPAGERARGSECGFPAARPALPRVLPG